jgi:hypothetical protein
MQFLIFYIIILPLLTYKKDFSFFNIQNLKYPFLFILSCIQNLHLIIINNLN